MFQRSKSQTRLSEENLSTLVDHAAGSSDLPPPPTLPLSRHISTDSSENGFVMLTPSMANQTLAQRSPSAANQHQRVLTPTDHDFEFIPSNPMSRSLSRNPSFTATLNRTPSSAALAAAGLDIPPITRLSTDYFLQRTRSQSNASPSTSQPSTPLTLSRNVSREKQTAVPSPSPPSTSSSATTLNTTSIPNELVEEEPYYDSYDDNYDEDEDELGLLSSRNTGRGRLSFARTSKSSSSIDSYLDDVPLRNRHQSSLGLARVTHKSQQSRKLKKAESALMSQRRQQLEQELQASVPTIQNSSATSSSPSVTQQPYRGKPFSNHDKRVLQERKEILNSKIASSLAASTTTSSSSASSSTRPVSNLLADCRTLMNAKDFITMADVCAHLSSTVASVYEARHRHLATSAATTFNPSNQQQNEAAPVGSRSRVAQNVSLPRAIWSDFPLFQVAFYDHYKNVIEDCFHNVLNGVKLNKIELFEWTHLGTDNHRFVWSVWLQRLLNMLNEPLASGVENTRLELMFHHPPSCARQALATYHEGVYYNRHSERYCRVHCQQMHENASVMYTPSQLKYMRQRVVPQSFTETNELGEDKLVQQKDHLVIVCAVLNGYTPSVDGTTFNRYAPRPLSNHRYANPPAAGALPIYPEGKPHFNLVHPMKMQEVNHTTYILDPTIVIPVLRLRYEDLQPPSTHRVGALKNLPTESVSNKSYRASLSAALSSKSALQRVRREGDRELSQVIDARRDHTVVKKTRTDVKTGEILVEPSDLDSEDEIMRNGSPPGSDTEDEEPEDKSYLGDWGSLSELQREVIQRQQETLAESEQRPVFTARNWRDQFEEHEVEQVLRYHAAIEREKEEEAARARDLEAEQERQAELKQRALFESFYGSEDEREEIERSEAIEAFFQQRSDEELEPESPRARVARLASPFDEAATSVTGAFLAHSKLPRPSHILSATRDAQPNMPHHNYDANRFMRVTAKRHQTMQMNVHKSSKQDLNYPTKPKNQVRLNNQRNYRTEFYNQPTNEADEN